MLLKDALAFVAGEICVQVAKVIHQGSAVVKLTPGRIDSVAHTLWLVKGGKLFTLIKHEDQTLVFCHDNKTMYYGSPEASMHADCPDGYAFLVQTTEDLRGDGNIDVDRRLLVMDMVAWPEGTLAEPCARERREFIWKNAGWFSQCTRVQWGGDRGALETLLSGGLPHQVSCVVAIKAPLHLIKEVLLQQVESRREKRPREDLAGLIVKLPADESSRLAHEPHDLRGAERVVLDKLGGVSDDLHRDNTA